MKILFASQNQHKIDEVSSLIPNKIELLGLNDLKFEGEIPETKNTIVGNALQKAHYVYDKYSYPCFADDTGLFIEALNGEPGVYSARWSDNDDRFSNNIEKALFELADKSNRKAYFKTVIAFINDGQEMLFEGIINGEIILELRGSSGFGYDPIFIPDAYDITFAEMDKSLKNKISHRALAMKKFTLYLSEEFF